METGLSTFLTFLPLSLYYRIRFGVSFTFTKDRSAFPRTAVVFGLRKNLLESGI